MPTNGTCAILFDEDDCSGWQLHVNEGYTELPKQTLGDKLGGPLIDNPKKNDAEAVLVRKGCILVGYDHDRDSIFTGLGKAAVVAAVGAHKYQNFDEDGYKDIDEKISSVDCVCSGFSFSANQPAATAGTPSTTTTRSTSAGTTTVKTVDSTTGTISGVGQSLKNFFSGGKKN
ncbi:uncharacterized protein LOC111711717 isoform X2 [Eurytemora carolleeae]|nr:uncharacterized protein LOC111711717 isoform X2 [Eurytemora carolleeae]|eukprot:XP_023341906.1 uncharacterized protein LOC111711717 isoform X2 [Eurytemora affinis]